jgi:hypothetical protein
MKQTNINIDEIKRYPTVTNPIKADDLHTPQAYAYTLRRAIVTDCNDRQRAELVKLLEGKDTAEGVTFNNTKTNRDRLHIWQNRESRKQRAAILGEGWQYIEGLNHGTQPGDVITCTDGTRGRVTKSDPESCCIEFETADGRRLSVAGYFRYTPSEKSETADERKAADIARERQEKPGTVHTSWATDFTPEDFQKLTSRYEIADEDRDIVGRRFHTGEGLWTVDVFVSDYAGNEAHALIYLLTGEGEVRANVLSLDHLRQTLTESKGWTRTA